jgi:hypothetical protein
VRITRQAISPRLAIRIFPNGGLPGRLAAVLAAARVGLSWSAGLIGLGAGFFAASPLRAVAIGSYLLLRSDRRQGERFMASLSNHEAPHRCPCEAFMVRQAHHEGC